MTYIIDAHEDMAYNFCEYGRDYRLSAGEIRRLEAGTTTPQFTGQTLLGWEDYQRGKVALIFSTLFITPAKNRIQENEKVIYKNPAEANRWFRAQIDHYHWLEDTAPDKLRLVKTLQDLDDVMSPWDASSADYPSSTHPVGLLFFDGRR